MAIQSAGEFQVVLGAMMLQLERVSLEQPNNSTLISARRDMRILVDAMKTGKPTKLQVAKFIKATEYAREVAGDLYDCVMDLNDFIAALELD